MLISMESTLHCHLHQLMTKTMTSLLLWRTLNRNDKENESKFFFSIWYRDTHFPLSFQRFYLSIVCSHSKVTKVNSKISLMKSSENDFIFSPAFYLIMCPMKAQKIFLKIFIFKTVELVSFWCVKTHFGKLPMKWCIFRHNKIWL